MILKIFNLCIFIALLSGIAHKLLINYHIFSKKNTEKELPSKLVILQIASTIFAFILFFSYLIFG